MARSGTQPWWYPQLRLPASGSGVEEGPVAHMSFPSGGILLQQPDRRQEISLSFKKEDMRIVIRRSEWVEGQKVNGRTSVRQNFESRCNKQLLFKGTG